jgi:hypothetical protein
MSLTARPIPRLARLSLHSYLNSLLDTQDT